MSCGNEPTIVASGLSATVRVGSLLPIVVGFPCSVLDSMVSLMVILVLGPFLGCVLLLIDSFSPEFRPCVPDSSAVPADDSFYVALVQLFSSRRSCFNSRIRVVITILHTCCFHGGC